MTEEGKAPDNAVPDEGQPADAGGLQAQLEEAQRERDQFRAIAQRAQADLINFKKRAEEERLETRRNTAAHLISRILSSVDDLDRALAMIPGDDKAPGWLEGVTLVRRNMLNILESEGVTRIEAMGKPFDPSLFEAVLYQEVDDAEEGTVLTVVRDGYKINDRVLRAAQVVVAKKPE